MEHYWGKLLRQRYRLTHKIGQGGMATVYLAQDTGGMNALVAVKRNDHGNTLADQQQFEKEASALVEVSADPNCPRNVPLFREYFVESEEGLDSQYLSMNYIEGEDLESILARVGALSAPIALFWLDQIMQTLEYLHNRQPPIIHRDIKPSNIRVSLKEGIAYLVDFGIAGASKQRILTEGYSPPEQYNGLDHTDARSDIYALGATLYSLLTATVPPASLLLQAGAEQLTPLDPRKVKSVAVRDAVEKAMQSDPTLRFQTTAEMRQALQADVPGKRPFLQIIAQLPTQLMPPPTLNPRQTASWWAETNAQTTRMTLTAKNIMATNDGTPALKFWAVPRWDAPGQMLGIGQHRDWVSCIAPSRDGALIATGSWDRAIRLWNADTGQMLREWASGHQDKIGALALSPDRQLLVSASPDGVVLLWEINRPNIAATPLAQNLVAHALDFSPDGKWLAAACADDRVRVWNAQTRVEEKSLDAEMGNHAGPVMAIAFSPKGDLLAAGGADRLIHLFETRERKTRAVLNPFAWTRRFVIGAHTGRILQLAFSPDGDYIAAAGESPMVSMWDVTRDRLAPPIGPFHDQVTSVCFGRFWYLLAVATRSGAISLMRLL